MRAAFGLRAVPTSDSSEPTKPALSGGASSLDVAFVEPGVDAPAQLDVLQPVQGGSFDLPDVPQRHGHRCGGIAAERFAA